MGSTIDQMSEKELKAWASKYKADDLLELSHTCKEKELLSPNDRQFLYKMGKLLHKQNLTPNMIRKLKRIIDQLEAPEDEEIPIEQINTVPTTHITVRMAWHDNGWNGRICNSPEDNIYCVGQYSLLSRRIRERRNTDLESKNAGKPLDAPELGDYIPPCFWSINAKGDRQYQVKHDNPAAPKFPAIEEDLPPQSIFTWPFKLSFVRDQSEKDRYGKYYPEKLFHGRINRFKNGIEDYESIAFLYTNYDNPISGDIQQYLLIGAAFITDQGESKYFHPEKEQIESIRKRKDSRNFPLLNWALRYSLDLESEGFLLPYEHYLVNGNEVNPQYQDMLEEVRVVISEPEIVQYFKYVSMPTGDDTAIMLLAKMRKSLLLMIEQAVVNESEVRSRIEICDRMIQSCFERRTHFPGFAGLVRVVLGLNSEELQELDEFITKLKEEYEKDYGSVLVKILDGDCPENFPLKEKLEEVLLALNRRLNDYSLTSEAFARLSMLNLTQKQFYRILTDNSLSSLSRIAENPYILAEEYQVEELIEDQRLGQVVDGPIGMHNIDIAFHPPLGIIYKLHSLQNILPNDPKRIRPLILKYLRSQENYGHCYSESRKIEKALRMYPLTFRNTAEEIIPTSLRAVKESFSSHLHEKIRWHDDGDYRFFYLSEIQESEKLVRTIVEGYLECSKIEFEDNNLSEYIKKSVELLKQTQGDAFNENAFISERRKLYSRVLENRLTVITGSPGTGKSYELLRIFRLFRNMNEHVLLLAPTGKAVQRLSEDTTFGKVSAKTIDKFLNEYQQQEIFTIANLNVMIDECSMVDLLKITDLFKKLDAQHQKPKRIILIGDRFQLPPIGFGKPFFDIIDHLIESKLDKDHLVHLSVNCRYKDGGIIARTASIFGEDTKHYEPALQALIDGKDQGSVSVEYWTDKEDLYNAIDSKMCNIFGIPRNTLENNPSDALDDIFNVVDFSEQHDSKFNTDAIQIISPYRTTYSGTSGINYRFQSKYRDTKEVGGQSGDIFFRIHDKIVVTKNTYRKGKLELANGTMGIIPKKGKFSTSSGDLYDLKDISVENFELAYCLTVHKAQGSGFDHVFVVIPKRQGLLSRELLYTAISRAKESVHLFIQDQEEDCENEHLLSVIQRTSHVLRRNTSIFKLPEVGYSYIPEDGVVVKSRVEYIIYRKLKEYRDLQNDFEFDYERTYSTPYSYDIHPDFFIELSNGEKYYWEHLGRTNDPKYVRNWYERKEIYKRKGDFESVVTTDEEQGISDEKIAYIIEQILSGNIGTEFPGSSYSDHHFSLA